MVSLGIIEMKIVLRKIASVVSFGKLLSGYIGKRKSLVSFDIFLFAESIDILKQKK